IANRAGLTQTLTYDAQGRLTSVTDPFGRMLTLTYDTQNHIATMTDPAGGVYTYHGDNAVIYPDGKTRTYLYEDHRFPTALTCILDENSQRFATYAYDAQGRAISSEHAGGAEKTTLTYNANSTTTVTDARNTARIYSFTTMHGTVKATSFSQPSQQ